MKTQVVISLFSLLIASFAFGKHLQYLPQGFCPAVVDYTYYSLCYDSEHRQASWVKYELTQELISGKQKRTNNYRQDPNVEDPVFSSDYKGSGYDRGHLLPAAAMKLNYQSMNETFFMTNMSPQVSSFNRGIWASIERRMRDLVRKHGTAHVITAPILDVGLPTIRSGVSIPKWYYKIAYFPGPQIMKAFLIENKRHSNAAYSDFLVTVDEVEALSGLDFYSSLPDMVESEMESTIVEE